jgi:hypothetical protein
MDTGSAATGMLITPLPSVASATADKQDYDRVTAGHLLNEGETDY